MNNDNYNSDTFEDYEGWCQGYYVDSVFPDGSFADGSLTVHDTLGDGSFTLGSGGELFCDPMDEFYWTKDMEFGGVQGDVSQIGPFNYIEGTKIVSADLVVNPIPEPVTLALLGLGACALLGRKRK